jgi:transposase
MRPERFVISDRSWQLLEPLLPGSSRSRGVTAGDNRLFRESVLWKVRVGGPWRDLPPGFGAWNSVFRRFRRWAEADVFQRIFDAISGEPAFEYVLVDGTIISAHQKASGAKGGVALLLNRVCCVFGANLSFSMVQVSCAVPLFARQEL